MKLKWVYVCSGHLSMDLTFKWTRYEWSLCSSTSYALTAWKERPTTFLSINKFANLSSQLRAGEYQQKTYYVSRRTLLNMQEINSWRSWVGIYFRSSRCLLKKVTMPESMHVFVLWKTGTMLNSDHNNTNAKHSNEPTIRRAIVSLVADTH